MGDFAKKPDYDISGLPCPDFSRAGERRGRGGPTLTVFACHAKLHIHLGTPLLVIENVQDRVRVVRVFEFMQCEPA